MKVTGAGYNDQGEIRIHNCDVMETAWQSVYRLLEASFMSSVMVFFRNDIDGHS